MELCLAMSYTLTVYFWFAINFGISLVISSSFTPPTVLTIVAPLPLTVSFENCISYFVMIPWGRSGLPHVTMRLVGDVLEMTALDTLGGTEI